MRNNPFNKVAPGTTIPGAGIGVRSMDDVHRFNNEQIRRKGFSLRGGVGANLLDIKLPGSARFLCGLLVFDTTGDPANIMSLIINNDTRIEQVSTSSVVRVMPNFADLTVPFSNSFDEEFFPMPCLLSGNDAISMEWNLRTGGEIYVTFYYI